MKAKKYLSSKDCTVVHSAVAKLMFPSNKTASAYFSKKLNGIDGRVWTKKDEEKAIKALHELGKILLQNFSVFDYKV